MYTTQAKVEAYSGETLSAAQVAQFSDWLEAVKLWIDKFIGYGFEDVVASHRIFDGSGDKELFVDPFYSITGINTMDSMGENDVAVDLSHVAYYPLNEIPTRRIRILSGCNISKWPAHKYAVDIEAIWGGDATVPKDVELAATMLMADLLSGSLSSSGGVTSESLGDYSISYGAVEESAESLGIQSILAHYRQIEL